MNTSCSSLRSGDWMEVLSAEEIALTLDANGTLDGLPFMQEMVAYCGRKFRFNRAVHKTCIEVANGDFRIREMRDNDIVLLADLRCPGTQHGGCQRACTIFWKLAWLRPVIAGNATEAPNSTDERLLAKLKSTSAPGRYFCQSTELNRITRTEPMARSRILRRCFQDVHRGAVATPVMFKLIVAPLYRKMADKIFGRRKLAGALTRTPVGALKLQAGEIVEVKSLEAMKETLDTKGRNRGLTCDIEVGRFCGKEYKVRHRVERMISEPTGEMRQVESTVVLDGIGCLCARALGGCPRSDFMYWREVWLKRPGEKNCGSHSTGKNLS